MKANWQTKRLSEICDFQRGLTYSKKDETDFSDNVVLRSNNIDLISNSLNLNDLRYVKNKIIIPDAKKVKKDSIIICTANGSKSHLGKVALIDKDYGYAFGGFMGQLTPKNEIDSKYFFYLLQSDLYKRHLAKISSGANINNLKFSDLSDLQVPIPPLLKQQRIVKILDELFKIALSTRLNAEKNLHNSKELFESYLQLAFTQSSSGISSNLGDICVIKSILVDPRNSKYHNMLHVGGANIESNSGKLVNLHSVKEESLISGKFEFDNEMVLYSKIRPYLKKVARPNFAGLCSADIYPLYPKKGILNKDYLFYLLLSPEFTDYAIKGSGRAGMPKVNREHLFRYSLQVPSLSAQKDIAAKLDSLFTSSQALQVNYRQKANHLDELKQSVLAKAFAGEL